MHRRKTAAVKPEPKIAKTTHDGVDERLNVLLLRAQPQPDRTHQDRKAHVHGNADAVRDHVAVALDERSVDQRERDHKTVRTALGIRAAEMCARRLARNLLADDHRILRRLPPQLEPA